MEVEISKEAKDLIFKFMVCVADVARIKEPDIAGYLGISKRVPYFVERKNEAQEKLEKYIAELEKRVDELEKDKLNNEECNELINQDEMVKCFVKKLDRQTATIKALRDKQQIHKRRIYELEALYKKAKDELAKVKDDAK